MPSGGHPIHGLAPCPKAHHCWSTGTARCCRSSASPGLAETGQRALPRCRTGPSHRQGDRAEEEPQTQSSWLAQGVLERGTVMSTMGQRNGLRDGGRRGPLSLCCASFSYYLLAYTGVCTGQNLPTNPRKLAANSSDSPGAQQ